MKYPIEYASKSEYFKKMYDVHETIKTIKENIDKLYASADYISPSFDNMPKSQSNPNRLVDTITEMYSLREYADYLLKERAKFDLFVCSLEKKERRILSLKCEKNMTWKEIAADSELGISATSAERIFNKICSLTDEKGLLINIASEKA